MAKFHVNPNTGNPGACSAEKGNCPYGSEDQHFGTAEKAYVAYSERVSEDDDPATNAFATFGSSGLKDENVDKETVNTPKAKKRISEAGNALWSAMHEYTGGPIYNEDAEKFSMASENNDFTKAEEQTAVKNLIEVVKNRKGDYSAKDIDDAVFVLSAAESQSGYMDDAQRQEISKLVDEQVANGKLTPGFDNQSAFDPANR